MSTSTKGLSARDVSVRHGVKETTARLFMHKVREAMKSSESQPMDEEVHIDEFVVRGEENDKPRRSYHTKKKKTVCALQLTPEGKVNHFYALNIED